MDKKTEFYLKRTMSHIKRVHHWAMVLVMDPEFRKAIDLSELDMYIFLQTVLVHDTSKFDISIAKPYVDFTWMMNEKKEGRTPEWTDEQQYKFDKAWNNHWNNETHHPELSKAYKESGHWRMENTDIMDCACDLQAMAQEFGGTAREFYESKWSGKHRDAFTEEEWVEVEKIMLACFDCFERNEVG